MKNSRIALAAVIAAFAAGASAQQYAYPAKGQSPDQQKKDEAACHQWAVEQSKFDPTKPPPAAAPAPQQGPTGARARGAAAGAAVGAITDKDTGDAAKVGAVAAASAQRGQRRRDARAQEQQATQQAQSGQASYAKARGACLEGKGYTVK